jgi:hypothetical protein
VKRSFYSLITFFILLTISSISFLISSPTQEYAATPQVGECRCEQAGKSAPNNGIECYMHVSGLGDTWIHDSSRSCATNAICTGPEGAPNCTVPNGNQIQSQTCTCESPGSGPSDNGMDCNYGQNNQPIKNYRYCKSYEKCENSPSGATCQLLKCTCDHAYVEGSNNNANAEGSGNNTMSCTDDNGKNINTSCSLLEVCTGNSGSAYCMQLPCTCDNPNDPYNRGFTCGVGSHDTCQNNEVCTGAPGQATCKLSAGTGPAKVVDVSPPPPPCAQENQGKCESVNTAFGIWSTDPAGFVKSLFGILLSLTGGIAVLIIMYAGYQWMMSQGNPDKLQAAREQLIAALVGLLFIIFSFVILEIIGVDILHIPGFQH